MTEKAHFSLITLVISVGALSLVTSCAHRKPPFASDGMKVTTKVFAEAPNGEMQEQKLEAGGEWEVVNLENQLDDSTTAAILDDKTITHSETGIVTKQSLKHPSVQNWIKFFTRSEKSRFQRYIDRAEPYRKVVQEILVKNGVPADIFYLGIIESGYLSSAKSTANAVGVWQFIADTGERYGLKVNSWVDDRRDIIQSTEAAAKYLKDLHNVFNSWELALAAYNTGEGRVLRAILRAKSRDFWTLLNKNVLPDETKDYVPKFAAAAYIYENAKKYGFDLPEDEDHPRLALAKIPSGVHLFEVARVSQIDYEKLKFYNSHLLKSQTPPYGRIHPIWVPRQYQLKVMQSISQMKQGNAGIMLAESQGFSPRDLASAQIEKKSFLRSKSIPSIQANTSYKAAPRNPSKVFAKRGQNLEDIARLYGTSIQDLMKFNRLNSSRIMAGQEIKIPPRMSASFKPRELPIKTAVVPAKTKKLLRYKVQRGDSLNSIADQFGVSVEKLQKDNRLRRQTVFAGEMLRVDRRGI